VSVEISVESYVFTCARCATRWTESYQVNQVIDDSGTIRSFYRHHGDPCEAPVSGNVECPRCHASKAQRDPLYGQFGGSAAADPADRLPEVPPQAAAPEAPDVPEAPARPSRPARHRTGTWRRFKFSAVVTLDTSLPPGRQYLSGVPGLVLHAPSCQLPARHQYFPAVVYTDDNRPLRPGTRGSSVIITVPDDDAAAFFQPGQHFTVWDGTDIGHGTVGEHLVFRWPF
jgi:hypothetical protein